MKSSLARSTYGADDLPVTKIEGGSGIRPIPREFTFVSVLDEFQHDLKQAEAERLKHDSDELIIEIRSLLRQEGLNV